MCLIPKLKLNLNKKMRMSLCSAAAAAAAWGKQLPRWKRGLQSNNTSYHSLKVGFIHFGGEPVKFHRAAVRQSRMD